MHRHRPWSIADAQAALQLLHEELRAHSGGTARAAADRIFVTLDLCQTACINSQAVIAGGPGDVKLLANMLESLTGVTYD